MEKMTQEEAENIIIELYDYECRARRIARLKVGAIFILLGISLFLMFWMMSVIQTGVYNYYGVN